MANKTNEVEDNSIEAMVHQGKSIAQWEKDFNGEFTTEQLAKLVRGGVDLQKLLYSDDLNEEQEHNPDKYAHWEIEVIDPSNKKHILRTYMKGIKDEVLEYFHDMAYNTFNRTENFKLLSDTLRIIPGTQHSNKLHEDDIDNPVFKDEEFFFNEKEKQDTINEVTDEEAALAESNAREPEDVVTVGDFIEILRRRTDLDDKIVFRTNKKDIILLDVNANAGTALIDLVSKDGARLDEEDKESMKNEGKAWHRGGYGGTGKSYRRLGDQAPRGAAIGWFAVEDIDPKAKGKMYGWRMGPSNFPFKDLLYPERKYKVGTTTMRNKYVKAGSMSGEKYIALPSYFDAIKNNDQEAIGLLNALSIPLDLTFGMNPNDDYSMTYTTIA